MKSDTVYAILLGYWQRKANDYALYYKPVSLPELIKEQEPRLVEDIRMVIVTNEQFRREVAAWLSGSIGQVQITIEKNIEGNSLEQTIKYSKFKPF